MNNGTFQPSRLREKQIYYPKRRVAQVPSLNDKIVQHIIVDYHAYALMVKPLIKEASANTKGRGTDYGRDILIEHLRRFWRLHKKPPYILKGDVHSFFASIPHGRLLELIREHIEDADVRRIMESFVGLTERGSPLGLQQSQLTSNLYLSDFDHKIKEAWHEPFYGRHMDDFYVLSESRERLEEILNWAREYLGGIGLELNPKTAITFRSFDYLGYRFIVSDFGKVIVRLAPGKLKSKRRHLRKIADHLARGEIEPERAEAAYFGWRVHAIKARNARTQILKTDAYFDGYLQKAGYKLYIVPHEKGKIKWRVAVLAERGNNAKNNQ